MGHFEAFFGHFGSFASLQLQPLGVFWPNPCLIIITEWTGSMIEISYEKWTKYFNFEVFWSFLVIFAILGLLIDLYDAQGYIFLLFLLSYTSLRLSFWIFHGLGEKISLFFITFWYGVKWIILRPFFGCFGSLAGAQCSHWPFFSQTHVYTL